MLNKAASNFLALLVSGIGIACTLTKPALAQAPPPAPKYTKADSLSADLFMSITAHNQEAAIAALKAGADPNRPNWLPFTPLGWASFMGETDVAKLLLAKGAKMKDGSQYGEAVVMAALQGHDELGVYLLNRGGSTGTTRTDKATPLMIAASNGSMGMVRRLLQMHADPNVKDVTDATALTFAARRNQVEAAQAVLAAGAKVNAADSLKRTPLHYAAANGFSSLANLLLRRGASVNSKDSTGATPLHLASRYSGDPKTIQALLRAGASPAGKDGRGKSPYELAEQRAFSAAAALLKPKSSAQLSSLETDESASTGQSVTAALSSIQKSMRAFPKRSACVSCHHQGLGLMTLARAAKRRVPVDGALIGAYMKQLGEDGKRGGAAMHAAALNPRLAKHVEAVDIGDFPYGIGYILGAAQANGVPANPGFADGAVVLGSLQNSSGAWTHGLNRGTMQISSVTSTALALPLITSYWPEDSKDKMERRVAKAKAWLLSVKPRSAEDMAARVLGLKAAGADESAVSQAAAQLLAAQRQDGGWRAPGAANSDAYTTGLGLYALRTAAGLPSDDAAIGRAVDFLVRTQDEDGTWYVPKVTTAFNNHFDAAFPHGYSQYSSFAGTCWATLGLLETLERRTAQK